MAKIRDAKPKNPSGAYERVFDSKELDQIDTGLMNKIICYDMEYSLGPNYLEKLVGFDIIFRSPSCLPSNPSLRLEATRGAIVTTEIEMFMELCPGTIIGVTVSDGKTTTTTLIYEILKAAGYNTYVGGNIGTPLFTKVGEMKPEDMVVVDLMTGKAVEGLYKPSSDTADTIRLFTLFT